MVALQWVYEFCPGAQYVLKTDDDGFNVPQRFVDYLIGVTAEKFIGGYCFTVSKRVCFCVFGKLCLSCFFVLWLRGEG
jgi:Galactosyltransferase